ncbi:histidine kinase dimerization/phosphoacceptor domain -containing protein [Flavobacterium sp. DGU11]|uniref:histidine kinase n=1 Tax=Flavobacterium arundinis TaxID=3139143 RepID=A0ABU9HVQ9_9FLAO
MKFFLSFLLLFTLAGYAQNAMIPTNMKWINDPLDPLVSIRSCVQDADGFLWIATEMGLYRYDGLKLLKIKSERFPDIENNRIVILEKNVLTGDILFQAYPAKNWYIIKSGTINRFNLKMQNRIVVHDGSIKWVLLNKKLKKEIENDCGNISEIKKIPDYNLTNFFITNHHLYIRYMERLKIINLKDFNLNKTIPLKCDEILFKNVDKIFISDGGMVYEVRGSTILKDKRIQTDKLIASFIDQPHKKDKELNKIISGNDDTYYLLNDKNLYLIEYLNNKLSTRFLANVGVNDITNICYDKNRSIYFITSATKGILQVKYSSFKSLQFKLHRHNINYSVAKIDENTIYSATGWQYNLKDDKVVYDNAVKDRSHCFLLDYNHNFYIQASNKVLLDINTFLKPLLIDDLKTNSEYLGYCWHKNILWIVTRDPEQPIICKQNDKVFVERFLVKAFKNKKVTNLFSWKDKIIISTEKGVYEYKPFSKEIIKIAGLETVYARNIVKNDSHSYWVCCYGQGLYLVSSGKVYKVNDRNLTINTAHTVETDKLGNIWISTNEGLLLGNRTSIIKNTLQGKSVDFYKFTIEDGLVTNEFNGGCTHPSVNDGRIIGFPTMKGFLWYDPSTVKRQVFSADIVVDKILADGRVVNSDADKYFVSKDKSIIEVSFSYAYYFDRENLSIEYKLHSNGLWKKVTGNKFSFARDAGGTDRLSIRISTHGTAHSVVRDFNFRFEKRYYETFFFWVIIGTILTITVYFAFRFGTRLNIKREEFLKQKVAEKTLELNNAIEELQISKALISKSLGEKEILLREIHHRVKNNLLLIISFLHIQSKKLGYSSHHPFITQNESRIISMALIHQNLYDFENSERVDFSQYLNNLVPSIIDLYQVDSSEINVLLENVSFTFDIQTAIPLGLIICEIINNSCKYAKRNGTILEITLNITKSNDEYLLVIKDNGPGFDIEKVSTTSFGIELTRLLAQQLQGALEIDASKGAKYTLSFIDLNLN